MSRAATRVAIAAVAAKSCSLGWSGTRAPAASPDLTSRGHDATLTWLYGKAHYGGGGAAA
jgi:hypothetical protein